MKNYIDVNDQEFIDTQVTMRPEDIFHTGALLTGDQIKEEVRLGNIEISGFDPDRLNENSYNVTLSPTIMTYDLKATDDCILDVKTPPSLLSATITDKYGYVIHPDNFYLGSTNEAIHSDLFVPIMAGRSSFGRLGFAIHSTGNFGDLGYSGTWTLQIKSAFPTRIYPNIEIAQIYFMRPYGYIKQLYHGKYQGSDAPAASKIFTELNNK